jgi:O-antigen/teichoic acid export membrane protein
MSKSFAFNLASTVVRSIGQLLIFAVLTRLLSKEEYGQYFVALSLIAIGNSLLDLGSYNLSFALKGTSKDVVGQLLSHLLIITLPSVLVIYAFSYMFKLNLPFWIIFCAVLIDLLNRMIMVIIGRGSLDGKFKLIFYYELIVIPVKFAGLITAKYIGASIYTWLALLICINGISLIIAWLRLMNGSKFIFSKPNFYSYFLQSSFSFAASNSMIGVTNEIEKPIMSTFLSFSDVAIYSIGQRIYSIASLPMLSWLTTRYPTFFGESSTQDKFSYAKKIIAPTVGLAVITIALVILAYKINLVQLVFGKGYGKSGLIASIMSISYILQAIYLPFADFLSGSGRQSFRLAVQLVSTIIYFVGAFFWLPKLGYVGAAINVVEFHLFCTVAFFSLTKLTLRSNGVKSN